MLKRLVVAASVSLVAIVGLAPAASAVPKNNTKIVSAIDWHAPTKAIDWHAPAAASVQRSIDWH
jgi:hypothetical protein